MQTARTLVCPGIWEPWGVVIHEGAAAGLPMIASYACGAITNYLRDGVNGIVIQPNPNAIRNAMLRMTFCKPDELERFGRASQALAELWSANKLAHYFVDNIRYWIGGR
jgi:glycosyltransferase involved in cell wall biosynthesis